MSKKIIFLNYKNLKYLCFTLYVLKSLPAWLLYRTRQVSLESDRQTNGNRRMRRDGEGGGGDAVSSLMIPSVPRHTKIGLNSYRDIMMSRDDISGVRETLLDKWNGTQNNIDQSI